MAQPRAKVIAGLLSGLLCLTPMAGLRAGATIEQAQSLVRARDYKAAADLLASPELASNPEALFLLASLYRAGRGVPRDDAKVFELTKAAADLGLADAQFSLGRLYLDGIGTKADFEAGRGWVEKAAAAGNARAAMLLVELAAGPKPEVTVEPETATQAAQPEVSDLPNPEGENALIEAARRNALTALKQILATGVSPDATDARGRTALMNAAIGASTEAARELVGAGASVGLVDQGGMTALAHAAESGDAAIVTLLLSAGADAFLADAAGLTPFEHGLKAGHCDTADAMMAQVDALRVTPTALLAITDMVAATCAPSVFARLRGFGVGIDQQDADGRTPLWQAAYAGNGDMVTYLLGQGADPAIADKDGTTPFFAAMGANQFAMIGPLLPRGDLIDVTTRAGNTPLIIVAQAGQLSAVAALVAAGANLDHRNEMGESALMVAARAGQEGVVRALLASGADKWLRNKRRERARDIAAAAGHPEIVALLE